MAEGQKLDSIFVGSRAGGDNLALPYEYALFRPFTDTTENDCRLVGSGFGAGSSFDCFVNVGGSIERRPCFQSFLGTDHANLITGKRIDKMWYYQTLPNAAGATFSWLLMSVYNIGTGFWEMYYQQLQFFGGATLFTNVRSINSSIAIHSVGFSRGLAYVKGTPDASTGEKLGGIIFDGTGGSIAYRLWGALGPQIPARIAGWTGHFTTAVTTTGTSWVIAAVTAPPATPFTLQSEYEQVTVTAKAGTGPYTLTVTRGINGTTKAAHIALTPVIYRDFPASDNKVDVKQGWIYSYSLKSLTDQITNRADTEHNPDLLPSNTGAFFDQVPKVTIQGDADTTNFPKLAVWRTTDGGGDFFSLEEVPNTGAGAITYLDDSLGSGASGTTFNNPIPDTKLDTSNHAPSLTSNSPPPTVNPPQVVGTDTPVIATKIVNFASRFWYAINHILYYSGDEEVKTGIPEECWPSGVSGNFFRFTDTVVSIEATSQALYILGSRNTYILTGTNKETFHVDQIASHCGMWDLAPDGSVSFLDRVAFITGDQRICVITGTYVDTISEPISGSITFPSPKVQLIFYVYQNNQWLMLLVPNRNVAASYSSIFIYDWRRSMEEKRDFWYPPWRGRINALVTYTRPGIQGGGTNLMAAVYDQVGATKSSALVYMRFAATDATGLVDDTILNDAWITESYNLQARIQPIKNPAGNHMNKYSVPSATTAMGFVKVDHNSISGNLGLSIFYDNTSTSGTSVTSIQTAPTRRAQSTGYVTKEWHPYTVGMDFGILVNNGTIDGNGWLQIDRIAVGMLPSAGPDSAGEGTK